MSLVEKNFISDVYIDICAVGDKKLAVYPNFIIFGKPIFDSHLQRVKFISDHTIKIKERVFKYFFLFLQKAFELFDNSALTPVLIYNEKHFSENCDLKDVKNCLFYHGKGEKDQRSVIITSTFGTKNVSFELDFCSFNELCESFSCLFFKSYCYTPLQNTIIEHFVHLTSAQEIQNICLKQLILQIKQINLLDLSPNETLFVASLIVRHRKLIILWRQFAVLNPRYQISEKQTSILTCKLNRILSVLTAFVAKWII